MERLEEYEILKQKLTDYIKTQDFLHLARALSIVENSQDSYELLEKLCSEFEEKEAKVIGFTGSPGAGKSSLISALIDKYAQKYGKVAVIAVDPSSPFSGGAILGDRVRMIKHSLNKKVFIRSVATRGYLGGLSSAVHDMITVLKIAGFKRILIETVGVGQSEIDVVEIADIVCLVLTPSAGDDIQAMKAGIMEIADVIVVNKADLGAERVLVALKNFMEVEEVNIPVVTTVALENKGIEELFNILEEAQSRIKPSDKKLLRLKHAIRSILEKRVEGVVEKLRSEANFENKNFYSILNNLKGVI